MNITALLDELSEIQCALDMTRSDLAARRTEVLRQVQPELDALDAEFQPNIEAATARLDALQTEIRTAVIAAGATVKGERLMAVYNRPRVSWDTKGLDGYMIGRPEIAVFRKEGEPSVTFRSRT